MQQLEEEIMADIFDEIDEELKRDRAQILWAKYGKYVISAAVAVIAAVALSQGYAAWTKSKIEQAATAYNEALKADDIDAALASTLPELTDGYAMLAKFRAAAAKAEAGDQIAAEQAYLALSADSSIDSFYQQAAVLLSVMNAADGAATAELQARLAPLADVAGGWQGLALELSAALDMKAGNRDAAKAKLEQLLDLPEIPSDLRQRAARLVNILAS